MVSISKLWRQLHPGLVPTDLEGLLSLPCTNVDVRTPRVPVVAKLCNGIASYHLLSFLNRDVSHVGQYEMYAVLIPEGDARGAALPHNPRVILDIVMMYPDDLA